MQTFLKKFLILAAIMILCAGCGREEDTPQNALTEIQVALADRDFETLSKRVDIEKFFAQIYDAVTLELAANYDFYKEKYPDDPYFQHDAEFLKKYNADFKELHLNFANEVKAAYFAKLPEPETPEENPYAYVANEFEKVRRAVNAEIQNVTIDKNSAEMTLLLKGDSTLRGQFFGELIFKFGFTKDGEKWHLNKIENLDELTPPLVDKAEIVWINFF